MTEGGAPLALTVPAYDCATGVAPALEGGAVRVTVAPEGVRVTADSAGLRDLARYCLALSDDRAFDGVHAHLDPDVLPLTGDSLPLLLERQEGVDAAVGGADG